MILTSAKIIRPRTTIARIKEAGIAAFSMKAFGVNGMNITRVQPTLVSGRMQYSPFQVETNSCAAGVTEEASFNSGITEVM